MANSRNTSKKSWIHDHPRLASNLVSLFISLGLGTIPFYLTDILNQPLTLSPDLIMKVALNIGVIIALFILSRVFVIIGLSLSNDISYMRNNFGEEIRNILYKTLHVRPHVIANNPIDEPSIETLLAELSNLTNRDVALRFAIDSLKRIKEKGFVQVRVNVNDYVDFLKRSCKLVEKEILVTCTVRPLWFFHGPKRSFHLEPFVESTAERKVRLVILKKNDIIGIIADTLYNLRISDALPHRNIIKLSDLPEIEFFLEIANHSRSNTSKDIDVYWCCQEYMIKPEWPGVEVKKIVYDYDVTKTAEDYAIFDDEFILKFNLFENQKRSEPLGDMFLSWGMAEIAKYKNVFQTINAANEDEDSLNDIGIFSSFKSLVRGCCMGLNLAGKEDKHWNINEESIDLHCVEDNVLKALELDEKTNISLGVFSEDIYNILVNEIGNSLIVNQKYIMNKETLRDGQKFQEWMRRLNLG